MALVRKVFSSVGKGDNKYAQNQLQQFLDENCDLPVKTILHETTFCEDGSILKKATVIYEDINEYNDVPDEDDTAHFRAMQQAFNAATGK